MQAFLTVLPQVVGRLTPDAQIHPKNMYKSPPGRGMPTKVPEWFGAKRHAVGFRQNAYFSQNRVYGATDVASGITVLEDHNNDQCVMIVTKSIGEKWKSIANIKNCSEEQMLILGPEKKNGCLLLGIGISVSSTDASRLQKKIRIKLDDHKTRPCSGKDSPPGSKTMKVRGIQHKSDAL